MRPCWKGKEEEEEEEEEDEENIISIQNDGIFSRDISLGFARYSVEPFNMGPCYMEWICITHDQ